MWQKNYFITDTNWIRYSIWIGWSKINITKTRNAIFASTWEAGVINNFAQLVIRSTHVQWLGATHAASRINCTELTKVERRQNARYTPCKNKAVSQHLQNSTSYNSYISHHSYLNFPCCAHRCKGVFSSSFLASIFAPYSIKIYMKEILIKH